MAAKRTAEEIQSVLEGYRKCDVTRAEYCRQQGIAATTLDYYRRRYGSQTTRFARVKITEPTEATAFALVLRNGRRIESAWNFRDAELARLIHVAEAD